MLKIYAHCGLATEDQREALIEPPIEAVAVQQRRERLLRAVGPHLVVHAARTKRAFVEAQHKERTVNGRQRFVVHLQ